MVYILPNATVSFKTSLVILAVDTRPWMQWRIQAICMYTASLANVTVDEKLLGFSERTLTADWRHSRLHNTKEQNKTDQGSRYDE